MIEQEFLTEQERIQMVSGMCAICQVVLGDEKYQEILDKAEDMEVASMETSKITGIPLEIVNSALRNLQDDGHIVIEAIETIE